MSSSFSSSPSLSSELLYESSSKLSWSGDLLLCPVFFWFLRFPPPFYYLPPLSLPSSYQSSNSSSSYDKEEPEPESLDSTSLNNPAPGVLLLLFYFYKSFPLFVLGIPFF